jgi:hypothetical protein
LSEAHSHYISFSVKFAYDSLFPHLGYEGLSIQDIRKLPLPTIKNIARRVFLQMPGIESIPFPDGGDIFRAFEANFEYLRLMLALRIAEPTS